MVMNARDIPECINSIKALEIDKVWLRGFTETGLEARIREFIEKTDYDRYLLVSDDVIVPAGTLDALRRFEEKGPVVTGWCNIFPGRDLAALELRPIDGTNRDFYLRTRDEMPPFLVRPIKWAYRNSKLARSIIDEPIYAHFPKLEEIWAQPELFRTYFVGWALTSIDRDTWLRYGFKYSNTDRAGHGSDQNFSLRAAADGLEMLCVRDAFVYHMHSMRNFIVGKVDPKVVFDPMKKEVAA